MERVFLILISIKLDSSSSTSIRSYRHQLYSLQRFKKRPMATKARKTDNNRLRIIDFKPKRMLRPLSPSWGPLLHSLSSKIRKLMSLTPFGEINSKRLLSTRFKNSVTLVSTSMREPFDKMLAFDELKINHKL